MRVSSELLTEPEPIHAMTTFSSIYGCCQGFKPRPIGYYLPCAPNPWLAIRLNPGLRSPLTSNPTDYLYLWGIAAAVPLLPFFRLPQGR